MKKMWKLLPVYLLTWVIRMLNWLQLVCILTLVITHDWMMFVPYEQVCFEVLQIASISDMLSCIIKEKYLLLQLIMHPLLLTFFFSSGSHESMLIVHALLEVASHPEYDIASMTFNFWHNLQVNLTKRWVPSEFYSLRWVVPKIIIVIIVIIIV